MGKCRVPEPVFSNERSDVQGRFWSEVWASLGMLCSVPTESVESVDGWKSRIYGEGIRPVFTEWFESYGAPYLEYIDGLWKMLDDFSQEVFQQATYMLEEANESGDCDYIIEMFALAVDRVRKEAERFVADVGATDAGICAYLEQALPSYGDSLCISMFDETASSNTDEAFLLEGLTC